MSLTRSAFPICLLASVLLSTSSGCPGGERSPPDARIAAPAPDPAEQEKRDALYALGTWLARNLAGLRFEESDLAPLSEGLADALLGRPLRVEAEDVGSNVQKLLNQRRAEVAAAERRAAAPFLAEAKARPGARSNAMGLVFESVVEGTGATPKPADRVRLDYEGRRRDGSIFDSSREHGRPGVFELTKVIPCWTQALVQMKVGGKARVTCPAELAYGDRGIGGRILPGAPLQFDLELLEIVPPEPPGKAP